MSCGIETPKENTLLTYNRYAVFGLGASGIAAANLLARRGKSVVASDVRKEEVEKGKLDPRVEVHLGGNVWDDVECVVLSPGLKPSLPLFAQLPSDLVVVPEVELARAASSHRWLGITGTDGKTTTTELTTHLLRSTGYDAVSAGNIGVPLCDVVDDLPEETIIVAELSAFQLWSSRDLYVDAMAVTNIAPDHLDYFEGDMEAYVNAKFALFDRCGGVRVAILNAEDPVVEKAANRLTRYPAITVWYGEQPTEKSDLFYNEKDGTLHLGREVRFHWKEAQLRGKHNIFNCLAAAGLVLSVGVPAESLLEPLRTFKAGAHRIEFVDEIDGVSWFNDSKATNPHASKAGMEALEGPLVAIVGGVDKKLDLLEYASYLTTRTKGVVVIGELRPRLTEVLEKTGYPSKSLVQAESLEEAVEKARLMSSDGDKVILSPACSSFDMFRSYADRGEQFCRLINRFHDK